MEKLTLRQFADVIKALVEADMPKEAGFTLKVVESGDKEKADGQKVELVCTKEEKKEETDIEQLDSGQTVTGILEVMADGFGFIRSDHYSGIEDGSCRSSGPYYDRYRYAADQWTGHDEWNP